MLPLPQTPKFRLKQLFFTIVLMASSLVLGHGSLTIRIQEKTAEISQKPNNPNLYFERGFLYHQHFEYNKAVQDYLKSEKLGNNSNNLHYHKAESLYYAGKYKKALKAIQLYFKTASISPKIYKLRAQVFSKLERNNEALESYNLYFKNVNNIKPKDILEYTSVILADDNSNYEEAVQALNFGLEKLGNNTLTLQLKKLDYLIASNQTEAVINQYNYFILSSNRKEFWYYKKAIFLNQIQQYKESNIALHQSKVAIALLSQKFQNTLAVKDLLTQINELENTLTP